MSILQKPQDDDDEDSEYEEEVIAERQQFGDKIVKKIEKWSVIVFFFSFLIFNIVYWLNIYNEIKAIENNKFPENCIETQIATEN